jgi:hypothetical protein
MFETHMFWAYGNLCQLEKVSVSSFLKNGYHVNLWTYGDISNAPHGTVIRNAREILPESEVFLNQRNSYASFSDLFRYAVLNKIGGLYSDADVIAIMSAKDFLKFPFLVTERGQKEMHKRAVSALKTVLGDKGAYKVNCNLIFNLAPCRGNIIGLTCAYSERFPKKDIVLAGASLC